MIWKDFILEEMKKDYFKDLDKFLKQEKKQYKIFPPKEQIFRAFELCPIDKLKIIILGMSPYDTEGQATGLAFSVNKNIPIPPSLKNIFKELQDDLKIEPSSHGSLDNWAKQGILLLNAALTVRENEPSSHMKPWEQFSNNVIKLINTLNRPIVYILWGTFARNKKQFITNKQHYIIESVHPSPLSAHKGFFGSKPFSKTNQFLISNNITPIDWQIK